MMMRKQLIFLSLVVLLLASCAGKSSIGYAPDAMYESAAPMARGVADSYDGDVDNSAYANDGLQIQESQVRMVIKNASLSIVVEEPGVSIEATSKLASDLGGFVVSSNLYRTQTANGLEVPQANITIRVPADTLDQALAEIKSGAGQILNENVSGQDITQEYTDLESRLRNLERAEEQLTEIMEQAWETEDVLVVYNRLVEVQEQIELIKGQMKYYEQSAALSAISINIQANEAVQPLKIGNWQPVGVAKRALQALINTLKFLADMLIWIVLYILPVVLILFFPVRWLWRWLKKANAKRKERKEGKKALKEKK
ncbi:MAG: DUF4349 domain-containing protein [Anaerolineales bacterium]|nr:DUF4349 domain-containing protein [Anaerolineales bacterium]